MARRLSSQATDGRRGSKKRFVLVAVSISWVTVEPVTGETRNQRPAVYAPWSDPLLDKRHFVDFLQGRDSRKRLLQRRFAQEGHSLFMRDALDFRSGLASRIISRIRSERSSSSWIAVRPRKPVPPHSRQPAPS